MSDFTVLDGITVDDIPVKFRAGDVLTDPESLFPTPVDEAVQDWLDEHPEVTTTVQDGSLTEAKFSDALKLATIKDYVTPEMFGAVGDGETDDTDALEQASLQGKPVLCSSTYFIGQSCAISNGIIGGHFIINKDVSIDITKDNLLLRGCEFENDEYYPSTGRGKWLVGIANSKNICIEGCYFHHGVSALYIDRCNNVFIKNNTFDDLPQKGLNAGGNGYGTLVVESKNVIIQSNVFHNVARHSVYISHDLTSSYNEDIAVDNNIFKWDSGVDGNTSGFEATIAIRPSKRVIISNNNFVNMFEVCSIVPQTITVNNVEIYASSEDVVIKNNKGTFNNNPRYNVNGLVHMPTGESDAPCKNLVIENNDFTIDKGNLVLADTVSGLIIKNNRINWLAQNSSVLIYAPTTTADATIENIEVINNKISNCTSLIGVGAYAKTLGSLVINGNVADVDWLGTLPSGTAISRMEIIDNVLTTNEGRTYFSSASVGVLNLANNIINKRIMLLVSPTAVMHTDVAFKNYGYESSNPTVNMAGCLNAWSDNSIYMSAADGTWVKLA